MSQLPHLVSRLYPLWWRKRYGDEFNALLDEARPGIGGVLDILKGALAMQFSNPGNPLRILISKTGYLHSPFHFHIRIATWQMAWSGI